MTKTAVLVMSYGTPQSITDITTYFRNIRKGIDPSKEEIQELQKRYERIGGGSPLAQISNQQGLVLGNLLGPQYKIYSASKYTQPYISETLVRIKRDGLKKIVAVNLTPFNSTFVNDNYFSEVEENKAKFDLQVEYLSGWCKNQYFKQYWLNSISKYLQNLTVTEKSKLCIIFTAHSLPQKVIVNGDTYAESVNSVVNSLAVTLAVKEYKIGWQSAGKHGNWLTPTVVEQVKAAKLEGKESVLLVPIGFISNHLEVLYDLDIGIKALCNNLHLSYHRVEMPNDDEEFIKAIADEIQNEVKESLCTK